MDGTPTSQRYSQVAVALHWTIAGLISFNLLSGFFVDELPRSIHSQAVNLHIASGIGILSLSLVRLAWRLTHRPPPLDPGMAGWERVLAQTVHTLFYVMMIVMPLIGWSMVSAYKFSLTRPLRVFGPFALPPIGPLAHLPQPEKEAVHHQFQFLHGAGGWIMAALLLAHLAGALKHQFVDRHPQLRRMWFGRAAPARV
jgi:cytochrome b561